MKRIVSILLCLVLLTVCFPVSAYEVTGVTVTAKNAMVASLDTGEILYSKAIDERLYPASITKLMTAAVILDRFPDQNAVSVTMTDSAFQQILGTGSAVLNAKVGETFSGKDALAAIVISSAGDLVYAYAEAAYGSVAAFTEQMNRKAAELGLTGTHYQNPIGLHDEQNYTTVRDIYTLSVYLLEHYPLVTELTGKSRYTMAATNMNGERILCTTNYMLDPNTSYYYPYCTGLKTGFTDEAGRCLVSTASYDGYRYLTIAMNCPTQDGTRTEFTTSRDLFRYMFNRFSYKAVLDTASPVTEMPVRLSGDSDYVSLYPSSQVKAILPKEADNSSIVIVPHLIAESVDAPVKRGDVLGTADVIYAEQVIGHVDLIAGNDVESSTLLIVLDALKRFVTSKGFRIVIGLLLAAVLLLVLYIIYINQKGKIKSRKVRYIPYDEEKEQRLRDKTKENRAKKGRPELPEDFKEPDDFPPSPDHD